jgi:hypothetical protein
MWLTVSGHNWNNFILSSDLNLNLGLLNIVLGEL